MEQERTVASVFAAFVSFEILKREKLTREVEIIYNYGGGENIRWIKIHPQSSFSLNWRRKAKPKVTMSIEQAQKIKLVLIHTIPHTTINYSYIQPCHLAGDWRLLLPLLASTFEFFSITSIVLPLILKSILQPTHLDLTSGFQCYDTFQQPFFYHWDSNFDLIRFWQPQMKSLWDKRANFKRLDQPFESILQKI